MVNSIFTRLIVAGSLIFSLNACTTTDNEGALDNRTGDNISPYGVYDADDRYGMNYNGNRLGMNTRNNILNTDRLNPASNMRAHQNTNVRESKKLANEIANMKEVRRANVLLTDNNAYIAVELTNNTKNGMTGKSMKGRSLNGTSRGNIEYYGLGMNTGKKVRSFSDTMTDDVKKKISKKVKSMDKNVKNVYVSANANFVDRINNYMVDIGEGRPVRGFMDEFNTFMNRVFPMNMDRNVDNREMNTQRNMNR
ncbi:YhcN/YlaJ family sporulation lipoprotein [Chengkuizengella marina]|uniref:YhcN/YlaJ family sporulation lipoprotein n=1 Tax=Chengkuizengella marina TaxID=2507566 RepID=A0A6N9Q2P4_9BACL|nr:YhcN/YlaJ family sporulation lipoprotein [Chengkuizengella marina]NBI28818.1 YhcN/YlaJ family sporulation lipoprotein [Chengkuizengella marina]